MLFFSGCLCSTHFSILWVRQWKPGKNCSRPFAQSGRHCTFTDHHCHCVNTWLRWNFVKWNYMINIASPNLRFAFCLALMEQRMQVNGIWRWVIVNTLTGFAFQLSEVKHAVYQENVREYFVFTNILFFDWNGCISLCYITVILQCCMFNCRLYYWVYVKPNMLTNSECFSDQRSEIMVVATDPVRWWNYRSQ